MKPAICSCSFAAKTPTSPGGARILNPSCPVHAHEHATVPRMPGTETRQQRAARLNLEAQCRDIGRVIAAAVTDAQPSGQRWGFLFMMFDFGTEGTMAYMANAKRADVIKMLDEFRSKLLDQ